MGYSLFIKCELLIDISHTLLITFEDVANLKLQPVFDKVLIPDFLF